MLVDRPALRRSGVVPEKVVVLDVARILIRLTPARRCPVEPRRSVVPGWIVLGHRRAALSASARCVRSRRPCAGLAALWEPTFLIVSMAMTIFAVSVDRNGGPGSRRRERHHASRGSARGVYARPLCHAFGVETDGRAALRSRDCHGQPARGAGARAVSTCPARIPSAVSPQSFATRNRLFPSGSCRTRRRSLDQTTSSLPSGR